MKFHSNSCPKESYSTTNCFCGFVADFLTKKNVNERAINTKYTVSVYKANLDLSNPILFDLKDFCEQLKVFANKRDYNRYFDEE